MKNNKQTYGIKKKLTAAVAMLLVATIMLVSTTYAWFTLSTAPEVKGISTAVGANGNLEIALTNPADDLALITTGTGDSMEATGKKVTESNVTWGNLVDLSDASYGLDQITLLPSKLNVAGGVLTDTSAVKVPTYGYDGRISEITKTAGLGYYDSENGRFAGIADGATGDALNRGVRAIGTSSTMSPRMAAYKTAKSNVTSYMNTARSKLSATLTSNGNVLVGAMLRHANARSSEDNDDYKEYVESTLQIVTYMESAYTDLGLALVNTVKAWGASNEKTDAIYEASAAITNLTELQTFVTANATALGAEMSGLSDKISALNTIGSELTAAREALEATDGAASVSWSTYSTATAHIADLTQITIKGMDVSALAAMASGATGITDLMNLSQEITLHTAPVVVPAASNGATSKFTTLVGKYDAVVGLTGLSVVIPGTSFTFSPADGSTALMKVEAAASATTVVSEMSGLAAPEGATGSATILDDMYGYILDFAIRTNAENSNLLLQRSGAQRVYAEETNAATQGAGSKMTFTSAPTENLANAIKLVFFDRDGGTVLAEGKLDTTGYAADKVEYEVQLTGDRAPASGMEDILIANMTKNGIYKLSVLVYLDGANITNADVAATEPVTVSGTLNLQFASSANLVPMENADMHNAGAAPTT